MLVAGLVAFPLVVAFAADPEQTSQTAPEGQPSARRPDRDAPRSRDKRGGRPLADVRVRVAIPATDMRFVDASRELVQGADVHSQAGRDQIRCQRRLPAGDSRDHRAHEDLDRCDEARLSPVGGDLDVRRRSEGASKSRRARTAEASLMLKPALYFRGIVVDEQGKPISGVKISANASYARGSGGVERTASQSGWVVRTLQLSREARPTSGREPAGDSSSSPIPIISIRGSIDVYALAPKDRESVRIVLRTGLQGDGHGVRVGPGNRSPMRWSRSAARTGAMQRRP